MMTKSSDEAIGPSSYRRIPGASAMNLVCSPENPLIISVSAPLLRTRAFSGAAEFWTIVRTPWAIDRTPTRTATTPAMPKTAERADPLRSGMD
jgi:hypothetical protein